MAVLRHSLPSDGQLVISAEDMKNLSLQPNLLSLNG